MAAPIGPPTAKPPAAPETGFNAARPSGSTNRVGFALA